MNEPENIPVSIESDRPQVDPSKDAFGYSPFAKHISRTIQKTPNPEGLVIAIHGPWGTGKTTILNFVKHFLNELPEPERIIVIDFNPWWFSDREHLAAQFIGQFQASLPKSGKLYGQLRDALSHYGGGISSAVITYAGGPAWVEKLFGWAFTLLKKKPKDVPGLKKQASAAIKKTGKRFVFIIDDIDRLTPNEICEVFKVVKALADFPNVIYLLSYDQAVVAKALKSALGVNGHEYLEKIVQSSFPIPMVSQARLREKFIAELNHLIEPWPETGFDNKYWWEIFVGLEQYLKKPRDLVRISNPLRLLLPAVMGEVNPVDFLAIEFLRVFETPVYDTIQRNKGRFAGQADDSSGHNSEKEKIFHEAWLENVPLERRENLKELIVRLFPRLSSIWKNPYGTHDNSTEWRPNQRICTPEMFEVYFHFAVSPEAVSRSELNRLLSVASDPNQVVSTLSAALSKPGLESIPKAYTYLSQINDVKETITPDIARGLFIGLFEIGDTLAFPGEELRRAFDIPFSWRLLFAIDLLLEKIPVEQRVEILERVFATGKALNFATFIASHIEDSIEKPQERNDRPLSTIPIDELKLLQKILIPRFEAMKSQDLLNLSNMEIVIHFWSKWGGTAEVQTKIAPILQSDDLLPIFLANLLKWGHSTSGKTPYLDPKLLENFTDIYSLVPNIHKMLAKKDLTQNQRTAGEAYLRGLDRIKSGKDSDSPF